MKKWTRDISGQVFGEYFVLKQDGTNERGTTWLCQCLYCDNLKTKSRRHLIDEVGTTCSVCTNKRNNISKEGKQLIQSMYKYGIAVKVIATTMDTSVTTVYKYIEPNRRDYDSN